MYGFAKNERENVGPDELATLKDLAGAWLRASQASISAAVVDGVIVEIGNDREENEF